MAEASPLTREQKSLKNGYCPLCGFFLEWNYDGHMFRCILKNMRAFWFRKIESEKSCS